MKPVFSLICACLLATSASAEDGGNKMLSFGSDGGVMSAGIASVETRSGVEMSPGVFLTAGIDLQSASASLQGRENNESISLSLLTIEAGTKYYLSGKDREKGEILTYAFGAAVAFVPMGSGDDGLTEDLNEFKSNVSLYGVKTAVGAEYFVSSNFAIGGETGANILIASFSEDGNTLSGDLLDIYTGFRLTFFL